MPFTPFHFGPGILIKSVFPNRFSLKVFMAAQIFTDFETLYFLVKDEWPVHRFLHTYVGATVVACVTILAAKFIYPVFPYLIKRLNKDLNVPSQIAFWSILPATFIGTYSHIFLDSLMHRDMRPFAPFSQENVLLGMISLGGLHLFCVLCGLLGIIRLGKKIRKLHEAF